MYSRPESDEAIIRRLLPSTNTDRADRAQAWAEWQETAAPHLYAFVRTHNNTRETDDDHPSASTAKPGAGRIRSFGPVPPSLC